MGIRYSFIDGELYGPEDINDITKSLTGAGVAPFVSKDSYNVSDLNVLTSALVGTGTELDGCKCSIANPGTEEMTVTVAPGVMFFESGVRLTVDEEGYILPVTPNTAGYVYAHYSPSLQKADIVFGTELPEDGEYVLLGEISVDGKIADKRTFAQSKIATLGKNAALTAKFTAKEKTFIREDGDTRYFAIACIPGVDLSKFNYVLVYAGEFSLTAGVPYGCFYDLNKNEGLFSLRGNNNTPVYGNIFSTGRNYSLWYGVEVFNNELCIIAKCSIRNNGEGYIGNSDFSGYTVNFI